MSGDLAAANTVIHGLYRNIGERIRTVREDRQLTQAALAAAVGLSRGSLANIESGNQRTPVHTMAAIAQALRLDPADLISDGVQDLPALVAELPVPTEIGCSDSVHSESWSTAPTVLLLDHLPCQVRAVRLARGLSLGDAAKEISCAKSELWRVENGSDCGIEMTKRLLSWLDHEVTS
jgi:transcriptional regulator with XRE-family HTH domain